MPHRVAQALGTRLIRHRPLLGGVSATVQALELAHPEGHTETVVLRSFPSDPPAEADRRIRQEAAMLGHLHGRGLPVPRLRWADLDGRVLGTPAIAMELLPGSTALRPEDHRAVIDRIGRLLAEVHRSTAPPDWDLPARVDPFQRLRGWLEMLDEATLRQTIDGVRLPAMQGPPCLLHGDIWPGNLLWQDGELVGLIDWEDAAMGDPLSDLAGSRVELAVAFGPDAPDALTAAYPGVVEPLRLASWDLHVAAASRVYMGNWGLAPDVLAQRRSATEAFFARTVARFSALAATPSPRARAGTAAKPSR